jgi:predicted DNA-binding transcriptional regulator AlpA
MPKNDSTTEPAFLLNVVAVAQMVAVSPRQIWRMANSGEFPRPISIGSKLKRWPRSVVERWIETQISKADRRYDKENACADIN